MWNVAYHSAIVVLHCHIATDKGCDRSMHIESLAYCTLCLLILATQIACISLPLSEQTTMRVGICMSMVSVNFNVIELS